MQEGMDQHLRSTINSSRVASQVIDGEVIMIDLRTGTYYSLDKAGALVWSLIEEKATVGAIIEQIKQRYDGDDNEIRAALTQLIGELSQEELIVLAGPADSVNNAFELLESAKSPGVEKPRFERPILQKYTDMQDLLLLDPIHEVDDAGWPVSKADR